MKLPAVIPEPYRLLARFVAVLLVLAAIYAMGRHHGADQVRGEWAVAKAKQAEAALENEQAALENEQAARQHENLMNERLRKAESDAEKRQNENRRLAGDAAAAGDRLRLALNAIRDGLPADSAATLRHRADTALAVLGDCSERYQRMAETADRHATDVQTLTEAWPK